MKSFKSTSLVFILKNYDQIYFKTLQSYRRNPYKNKKTRFCIELLFGLFFYINFLNFFFNIKKNIKSN